MNSPSATLRDMLRLTKELVRVDTINPPGNERDAAEVLFGEVEGLGIDVEIVDLGDNRANIELCWPGTGDATALLYCGHLDTMPLGEQPWSQPPLDGYFDGEYLWGRGSVDMKGGVAAAVLAIVGLAREQRRLPGDVRFLGTIGEEVDCAGARAALGRTVLSEVGHLVIGEPTAMEPAVAHKGALFVELSTVGRGAHAAMAEQGVNAVDHMLELIRRIEAVGWEVEEHPVLGAPSLTIGTLQGGTVVNLVPDRCQAQIDIRTVPGIDHDSLVATLKGVVDQMGRDTPGFDGTLSMFGDYPPVGVDPNGPLVAAAENVLRRVRGVDPTQVSVAYFSDGSIIQPASNNVPTLLCGPGDPNLAHQTDERVHIDQLEQAGRFYAELPFEIFGVEPNPATELSASQRVV